MIIHSRLFLDMAARPNVPMETKTMAQLRAEGLTTFDQILARYPGAQLRCKLSILDRPDVSDELKEWLRWALREGPQKGWATVFEADGTPVEPVPQENDPTEPSDDVDVEGASPSEL